ncbi:MAG: N-acetyltransferase [Hyphomonadaceae bacterium]|nr:N-acetyltransferase [Hyphomonadaceae bacterium]
MNPAPNYTARTLSRISEVKKSEWNGLQADRSSKAYHPFTDWEFLNALEVSECATENTGWAPCHIWMTDENERALGAAPLYAKTHSMGEYIFDHAWADASERAGLAYYPKLLCAIPFTPATGPRLIYQDQQYEQTLASVMLGVCDKFEMSGVHINFLERPVQDRLSEYGFLARTDRQFHFINKGYKNFDEFLAALSSRKRKKIRAERRRATESVEIKRLRGEDIKSEHWDVFFRFYMDTAQRKWGRPYLNRDFFTAVHDGMRDQTLLVVAYQDGTPIAGALNFIGGNTLYGRHWGTLQHIQFLHFELCYYQAIEAGIELGLDRVEAGAQGEHKLARGYEPVTTYSSHYLAHPGLQNAIGEYLQRERRAIEHNVDVLSQYTPFKKEPNS